MLKRTTFSVIFEVGGVRFREEYTLPYRTEEEDDKSDSSTLIQAAKGIIAKDLNIRRCEIKIIDIFEIHNYLILEEL